MHPRPFLWLIRCIGITLLFLAATYLIFGLFGKTDVSWLLPKKGRPRWPDLPFFSTRTETTDDDESKQILYTVPTRQLSAQEISDLRAPSTNGPAQTRPTSGR